MGSFLRYVAGQFGHPSGVGGTIVHFIMNKQNVRQYDAVRDNLHIRPGDIILDIGFGNGYLIRKLLEQNPLKVYGIEVSQDMLNKVGRKLKRLISIGKLDLSLASIDRLPYNDAFFDKICTVNTLYFWNDTESSFAEVKRTLKPDGIFINVFYSKEILDKMHHTQYEYSKYSVPQIVKMTEKSGLKINQVIEMQKDVSYCIIAKKPAGPKPLAGMTHEELWQLFPIILSEHQEHWKNDYQQEKKLLNEKIGYSSIERISHIGSTAIPGLLAKPTIDILLEIKRGTELNQLIEVMESCGYIYSPQPHKPEPHMMFMKGYATTGFLPPVFHVHLRYSGDWDEVYFRDFLFKHPETAEEYGKLKLKLKEQFEHDRDGYTEAKTEFIQRITNLAKECL